MKRMAAKNPSDGHKTAAQKAVFFYRVVSIRRTTRIIPASRREVRRDRVLVKPNNHKRYILHFNKPAFKKRTSSCPVLPERFASDSGKTCKIRSWPPQRRLFISLNASRPRRLARFLATAFPKPREKVKHIRLPGKSFFNTKSFAPGQLYRLPLLKTSFVSLLPFKCSRRLKRKEPASFFPPTGTLSQLIGLLLV